MRAGRREDMTKVKVALHNFANVPKNGHRIESVEWLLLQTLFQINYNSDDDNNNNNNSNSNNHVTNEPHSQCVKMKTTPFFGISCSYLTRQFSLIITQ
jgi:hypothetical protein